MDIRALRRDFPALENFTWLQNGGVSITPLPVAQEHARLMNELLVRGPMHIVHPQEEYARRRQSIAVLARFLGCEVDELALMRGVSEAFQTVLRGLDWRPGDRVLISTDEEAAVLLPLLQLRDLHGVEIVKVPLCADRAQQIGHVRERMGKRTRLVALSHVTTDVGARLPVTEICALARERGVLSFVDLAHSAGLLPLALRELGCDFAGVLSYKWMYAPYAAGALFVRRECIEQLVVRYAGGRSQQSLDFAHDAYELRDTAERFQYGPWSWPLVHAWAASTEYLTAIGLEKIWARTEVLSRRLKEGVCALGGELYTPSAPEASAALVSFGLSGLTGAALAEALRRRWNIVVKALPHGREGLRASMAFFLLEEEIDIFLAALKTLVAENRR